MALRINIKAAGPATMHASSGPVKLPSMEIELDCYARVVSVSGGKDSCDIICMFTDEAHGVSFIRAHSFTPSVAADAENFIRQAYMHLKSLPEFAGATDC